MTNEKSGHRKRLRLRFLERGARLLSDAELLELLLTFSIPRIDVKPIANRLLDTFGSIEAVTNAPIESLCAVNGVQESTATLLKLVKSLREHPAASPSPVGKPKSLKEVQPTLFDLANADTRKTRSPKNNSHRSKQPGAANSSQSARFPDPRLRVYAKDLAEHALKHIPKLVGCKSIDDIRKYLIDNLRFNSQATRQRNANYLISRYFPGEVVHSDVIQFSAAVEGKPGLGDALFYLTCRTEKIVALVAKEVVFPSLALGGVSRTKIRDFVQSQFPNSKSAMPICVAVVGTYQRFGVANATRTRLNVSLREGSLAAFAYLLHLEFPEPGMYSFEKMINGPLQKWLLWDQQWMVRQLYALREAGLLSKVSEIDRMRQFTTKYTLAEAMNPIVALTKESPA